MALALAAAGATVVVNVRSNKSEAESVVRQIESHGGKAVATVADVADAEAVERMVADAVLQFGRIDYLINNASLRGERHFETKTVVRKIGGERGRSFDRDRQPNRNSQLASSGHCPARSTSSCA